MGLRRVPPEKRLGRFYTPEPVARALARWAADSENPLIFEPSFGGCVFLYAALDALREGGDPDAAQRVFGVDIDRRAVRHLKPVLEAGASRDQFRIADFFDVTCASLGVVGFSAVVGNPPYIKGHSLGKRRRSKARRRLTERGIVLSGRASYWAYFLLHSLSFLREGGRLALVLPGAFLHADYAKAVRERVFTNFKDVLIILVGERVFAEAQEETVLLLASGWQRKNEGVRITLLDGMHEVDRILAQRGLGAPLPGDRTSPERSLVGLLHPATVELYQTIVGRPDVIRLRDWVQVRVGVVTGANRYFVVGRNFLVECPEAECFLKGVVARRAALRGLNFSAADLEEMEAGGKPSLLLVVPRGAKLPAKLREYLRKGLMEGVHKRFKCRTRECWYTVPDTYAPPAFLTYMSGHSPRIVVNNTDATCTNAIHRLAWIEPRADGDWMRLAVGSLSTLFQLSAELVARSYGGGVLKVEPGEARNLVVPVPEGARQVSALFNEADELLRQGKLQEATDRVDTVLLSRMMGIDDARLALLRNACDILRSRRRRMSRPVEPARGE